MKESNTTYAYLIEHMQNPSFQKIWDIAYDFVHQLPCGLSDELHKSLNRGVDVLDSEPLLQMYIYAFGKMHNARRTRQTLWGGRTDANPKLSLNDT